MTLEWIAPPRSTTAAQVSSQLVSRARITAAALAWLGAPRSRGRAIRHRTPHYERVLAVVVVVGAAAPGGAEVEALVQPYGGLVRGADLERVLLVRLVGHVEQPLEERAGDPLAEEGVVHRDVHDVPDGVVPRADQVADYLPVEERREADPRGLRQLEHEHRQRPGCGEGAPLDRDDLRQVRVGQ